MPPIRNLRSALFILFTVSTRPERRLKDSAIDSLAFPFKSYRIGSARCCDAEGNAVPSALQRKGRHRSAWVLRLVLAVWTLHWLYGLKGNLWPRRAKREALMSRFAP